VAWPFVAARRFAHCCGLHRAARQFSFIGAAVRGRASILFVFAVLSSRTTVGICWRGIFETARPLFFAVVALSGRVTLSFHRRCGSEPHDSLDWLARPSMAAYRFCSLSRPSQGRAAVWFVGVAFRGRVSIFRCLWSSQPFGAAPQLGFVSAAFGGRAPILLIVAAFTGPCDSLVSLAQPFKAARQFCLLSRTFRAA